MPIAPAFGVPQNSRQNLAAMDTGYHSCLGTWFDESELIVMTTSGGGLHPLPNGSLSLYWSASIANWSVFLWL